MVYDYRESLNSVFVSQTGYKDMVSLFLSRDFESAPPSSMMVISRPSAATPPNFSPFLSELRGYGHNSIFPYPYDSPQQASSTHARCLWKNFLLAGALDEEEDRCSDTGEPAFWVCTVCRRIGDPGLAGLGVVGRGVDNFITHLSTREHEVKLYQWFPPSGDVYSYLGEELEGFKEEYQGFDEEDEEAPLVSL
ncbi:PREDICTED: uncharacterized protein LOC104739101 [Camelina sativa]|uniref:Uncharacterized protein LOC104739101 n=1 Tax=Camelina sativa TaxID=90675 RepID=A0ABM1QVN3_CAMSA|nr:PREDICTED: uncharacterized protein LOC104739101 [Camelina sativa]